MSKNTSVIVTPPTIENVQGFELNLRELFENGKKLAVLLDFDGTLAPITTHPDLAAMEEPTASALSALASNPNVFVAIISGRGVRDVKSKVGISTLTYAGNHGLDILYPNGDTHNYPIADDILDNMTEIVNKLNAELCTNGAWVEDKQSSVTFHYREAPADQHERIRDAANVIITSLGFNSNQAHCALEVKPAVKWNKGEAALHILKTNFGDDWHKDINAVFAGDDTTDEDAMRALKGLGISFRVDLKEGVKTYADYALPSTKTVAELLQWLHHVYT